MRARIGDTRGARCDKIGRISMKTVASYAMIAATFTKTTGISGQTGRISVGMKAQSLMTVNNIPCGPTVRIFARIDGTSVPIIRIVGRTGARFERIDGGCATIGETCELIIGGFEMGLPLRVEAIGRQEQNVTSFGKRGQSPSLRVRFTY